MPTIELKVQRLSPDAKLPTYATPGAVGLDLYANDDIALPPGEFRTVSTGIAVELPQGYEAQIRPRSGLAAKYGITVLNSPGTIDTDYRGELKVVLINLGKHTFHIHKGMRIAQLVIHPSVKVNLKEANLSPTSRDTSGFGSTGTA